MPEVLSSRALGRATLARQLLLDRADLPVVDAVEALAGLQAQEPRPPYLGLFARVSTIDRDDVLDALQTRRLVRGTAMRGTLHLMSATQYAAIRPALQPVLDAALRGIGARGRQLDIAAVRDAAAAVLADGPMTFEDVRDALAARFPDEDRRALGYAARMQLPLVMEVVPGERWGFARSARFTPAAEWLGRPVADSAGAEALVRPYLAAFGPASAADLQAWSGLTGCAGALDALRGELAVFADERGRELFDLPGAPRPGGDVAAPPRLLPEFDNLVLAHQDRSRIIDDAHRGEVVTKNLRVRATFLIDGRVAGTWALARKGRRAVLTLSPFGSIGARTLSALTDEARRLAQLAEPDAVSWDVVSDASR